MFVCVCVCVGVRGIYRQAYRQRYNHLQKLAKNSYAIGTKSPQPSATFVCFFSGASLSYFRTTPFGVVDGLSRVSNKYAIGDLRQNVSLVFPGSLVVTVPSAFAIGASNVCSLRPLCHWHKSFAHVALKFLPMWCKVIQRYLVGRTERHTDRDAECSYAHVARVLFYHCHYVESCLLIMLFVFLLVVLAVFALFMFCLAALFG